MQQVRCIKVMVWIVAAFLTLDLWADTPEPNDLAGNVQTTLNETVSPYNTLDGVQRLYQPFLVNLTPYEPIYFLVGTDPEESKFQLSLKYRFFNRQAESAQDHPWLGRTYLGYTQTSYWDLRSASQPFQDTSYKPEVFYLSDRLDVGPDWIKSMFIQVGFQHESNGRGESQSRSTNFVYIKPMWILHDEGTGIGLMVAPKFWLYAGNDNETNPDLKDYRGFFDLQLKAGKAEGLVVDTHLRWAKRGGSMELNFTYPLNRLMSRNPDLYLQVQYVDALAESLLHYQDRIRAVRIGVAIVR